VLYRFRLDLSDVDRSVYETLDFRLALHPSESFAFLLTRMIAYALNVEPGLEFSPKGLGDPEDPCLSSDDPRGGKNLWIEVGNPSGRRLHKASKASKCVKVYTYKNPDPLIREIEAEKVHRGDAVEVYALAPEFLEELETLLDRDNAWALLRDGESLMITAGDQTLQGDLRRIQ
jgi:uncharacterized protein YaeQ